MLQRVTACCLVCCSVLQCFAVCRTVLQRVEYDDSTVATFDPTLERTGTGKRFAEGSRMS